MGSDGTLKRDGIHHKETEPIKMVQTLVLH